MAAHFDCPLVSWLSRERMRAARIDDFVSAIRRLHADFAWPYPSLPNGYSMRRFSSQSRTSTAGLEDKLQALEVDVTLTTPYIPIKSHCLRPEVGDSGYLSNVGNGDSGAKSHGGLLLQTVEAQLKPLPSREFIFLIIIIS